MVGDYKTKNKKKEGGKNAKIGEVWPSCGVVVRQNLVASHNEWDVGKIAVGDGGRSGTK
jgi:hypothetical protein